MGSSPLVVGLDIGGTKLNAGLVTADGVVVTRARRPTPASEGGPAVYAAVESLVAELIAAAPAPVTAIGVGSPGHIDFATGNVTWCTPNLPGWSGLPLASNLAARFGIPTVADNDANAALYGEVWQGGARGCEHALLLTLGTGVGGGILSHGQMIRGHRGGGAELGHIIIAIDGRPCNCGQRGCRESYPPGPPGGTVARERPSAGEPSGRAAPAGSIAAVTSHHVFAAFHTGDPVARSVMGELADHLAVGIVTLVNIFQPERILLGGGVASQGDVLLELIRMATRTRFCNAPLAADLIDLARLGEDAGLIGAAGLAWHHVQPGRNPQRDPHHA
ncbi:MAG: ROK family protein [Candidatus Sericytochromatia bacterium]|nr:ROK family protein [Candidatus Sericytochromatia bacterium]